MTSTILKKIAITKIVFLLSAFFIFAQSLPYEKVEMNGKKFYRYQVKSGEGLYAVARTFSTSIDQILKYNPTSKNGLKSGESLYIPIQATNTSNVINQNHTFYHTVSNGETIYSIARMYDTKVNEIYRFNPNSREGIHAGSVLVIPQRKIDNTLTSTQYRFHTITPKETLYAVSRMYNVSAEDILAANSGLSVETFQAGKIIRIPFGGSQAPPQKRIKLLQHKVKKGETLYGIAKEYNVSVDDIKKYNAVLKSIDIAPNLILSIPFVVEENTSNGNKNEVSALINKRNESPKINVIKIGLLMPFLEKGDYKNIRLQEYYEGFLLAVEKMKRLGTNIELYVFDIGSSKNTSKLQSLLGTMEMESLDIIIGGISESQINFLSDFAQMHQIKYVIPFSSKNVNVLENNNVFQINSPQSYVYAKTSDAFLKTYPLANIIFAESSGKFDKSDFVDELKNKLQKKGIEYVSVKLNEDMVTQIAPLLSSSTENIIIPTVAGNSELQHVIDASLNIQKNNPKLKLQLFGYPEWQTYDEQLKKHYATFNTTIFSSFFMDEQDINVKDFERSFQKWYKRDLLDLYPKFGMLGYDTALFFVTAFKKYGTNFENNISDIHVSTLQFPFYFERVNNWGGFINTGVYLVEHKPNSLILKKEIK